MLKRFACMCREWLWARVLLAASAAAAAAEQALQWPRRRARLLVLLAAAGFLAFKGAPPFVYAYSHIA